MNNPSTRIVFDRKHVASKTKKGLVQIEVTYSRKRKWISTGVKLYKDQWHPQKLVVNNHEQRILNDRLRRQIEQVDTLVNKSMQDGAFCWDAFERELASMEESRPKETFIDFMSKRIAERSDIKESTRRVQKKSINSLLAFGRIVTFDDLIPANIQDYYEWLMEREVDADNADGTKGKARMAQATVWGYMKVLKIYIHDAIKRELLTRDPSLGIKIKRGCSTPGRWLTIEEVEALEKAELETASHNRARDLFLVQCYTGMAYSDLMDFAPSKLNKEGELLILSGRRKKTGESYVSVVLPKLQRILEKYEYQLPKMSNQKYNSYLKEVAKEAKIEKPIASHWARRTCGMLMLNKGYPIEIVARVLGHSDIKTTQQAYAQILNKTVIDAFRKYEKIED